MFDIDAELEKKGFVSNGMTEDGMIKAVSVLPRFTRKGKEHKSCTYRKFLLKSCPECRKQRLVQYSYNTRNIPLESICRSCNSKAMGFSNTRENASDRSIARRGVPR